MANCQAAPGEPNTYASGNCTWWVKHQIPSIPNAWGNAAEWLAAAQACGYPVSQRPQVGAVAVWGPGIDPPLGFGHVAVVTGTGGEGGNLFTVSEMNWKGLGVVDTRNVTDRSSLLGFFVPAGGSLLSDPSAQLLAASSGTASALDQAGQRLVAAGQVGVGGLLLLAGLAVLGVLVLRPELAPALGSIPVVGAAARGLRAAGR